MHDRLCGMRGQHQDEARDALKGLAVLSEPSKGDLPFASWQAVNTKMAFWVSHETASSANHSAELGRLVLLI